MLTVLEFTYTRLCLSFQLYFLFQLFTASCFLRQGFEVDEGGGGACAQMPRHCGWGGFITQTGNSTHLLPSHLSPRREAECDNQCSPAAQGPGPQNHRRIMNATPSWQLALLWRRGGRTSLARTLAVYDETSSINQTIKVRAVKHLWNLWQEPQLIYNHYQRRAVSKLMCLELNCRKMEEIFTFQM